jgi:hypothetical protein
MTNEEFEAIAKKFPNYELDDEEAEIVWGWERQTGFDLMGMEDVKDRVGFKDCLARNVDWLKDWAQEASSEADHYQSSIYVDENGELLEDA